MDVILYYLTLSLSAIIVMTLMGFSKAYTSYKLGDIAIKNMGKVTLNPKKHFEILGFIVFVFFGYGWTAPVDTSSLYYKNRKKGNILVCVIPLIFSIICAFFSYFIYYILLKNIGFSQSSFLISFFNTLCLFFINFAIFNLIPIYPLFGQKLFQTLLPANKALKLSQYEKIIQVTVIFLLLSGLLQKVLDFICVIILTIISLPINLIF